MKLKEKNFEDYLLWENCIDILSVINIIEKMPPDIDDDIIEAIVSVIKSSKKEFIIDSKKIHMPKNMLKKCIDRCNESLKKYECLLSKDNKKTNYQLNLTDENINNIINNNYAEERMINIRNLYIKNKESSIKEKVERKIIINWQNYFNKWINAEEKEYNEKINSLYLNNDGTVIGDANEKNDQKEEIDIFRIVIYCKNVHKDLSIEEINRIIEYKLNILNAKNNIKIDNEELNKWCDFFKKWKKSNKIKVKLKKIELIIKEKIFYQYLKKDSKIEIEIFKYIK